MTDQKKVRWAILGAGKIAHKFAQDFAATERGELVAIASRDQDRAKAFASQYNISNVYNYDELYQSNEVDAVYIATPHNFHLEQSLQCLNAGKAVLCEKPITINDEELKKLVAAAKEKNVFLMEAMWTYFLPAFRQAKAWLDSGRIGTLKMLEADFGFAMPYDPQGRLYNAALAGGSLLDLGVYNIAFATYFTNTQPASIIASGKLTQTGVDESTCMILKYNAVMASLNTSMVVRLKNKALLFGDGGYIEIPEFWKARTATLYNSEHEIVETFNDNRTTWGYNFEIQEATDAILTGAKESRMVPHTISTTLQEIMSEVRRQIGFVYPMEK